jgi:hypothetical protein
VRGDTTKGKVARNGKKEQRPTERHHDEVSKYTYSQAALLR